MTSAYAQTYRMNCQNDRKLTCHSEMSCSNLFRTRFLFMVWLWFKVVWVLTAVSPAAMLLPRYALKSCHESVRARLWHHKALPGWAGKGLGWAGSLVFKLNRAVKGAILLDLCGILTKVFYGHFIKIPRNHVNLWKTCAYDDSFKCDFHVLIV